MSPRPSLLAAALITVIAATGCSSGVKQNVDVTITADGCDLSTTTLDATKTAFSVKNESGHEAEAYVYTASGSKVDEVEGIADGTTRKLIVSLDSGKYQFACKPEGSDHRTAFTVG